MKTLYRYQKTCHEETITTDGISNVDLYLTEYPVIRETPSFYVFREHGQYGKEKRTSKTASSRFAFPTKKEALQNFISRSKSSVGLAKYHIEYTQLAIQKAEELMSEQFNN